MHTCPDDGALRVAIDRDLPAAAGECPVCAARRRALADTRDRVDAALGLLAADADTLPPVAGDGAALARLRATRPDVAPSRRLPQLVAGVAVVLAAALVVGTPGGRSATASVLSVFRAERIAAVDVDPSALDSLTALDAVADVQEPDVDPVPVDDLDAAAAVAGFPPAPVPGAPAGEPAIMAAPSAATHATLSATRAPTLPPSLDGAVLHVEVPGVVTRQWAGDGGVPALMVVEAGAPVVTMEGGDLAEFRTWVIDDPGLPAGVADQLAALGDWRTTLPLPVPAGAARDVTVAGLDAVAVDRGLLRAVVWIDGDLVRAVAGPGSVEDLTAVAAGMVP